MAFKMMYLLIRLFLLAVMVLGASNLKTSEASAAVIEIQDFTFSYAGSTIFHDDFADGLIPTIPPYREVLGSAGMSESGGVLIMNSALIPPGTNFLAGAAGAMFSAGGVGYVQAVFLDTPPIPGEFYAIEIGNLTTGSLDFDIFNDGSNTFALFQITGDPSLICSPFLASKELEP